MSQADEIRQYALVHYVEPARASGHRTLTIRAGDICRDLGLHGRAPNVCSAVRSGKFLELAHLQLLERTGPFQSTTTRFRYAIEQASIRASKSAGPTTQTPLRRWQDRPIQSTPTPKISPRRDLTVVIQCAASKDPAAGHLTSKDGKTIVFVARPGEAPSSRSVLYRRPDDPAHDGRTWRDELLSYNLHREENPRGLLPAWQLYKNPVYSELVRAFGLENVFILSAGWGLLTADFLTPNYDITFSNQADSHKKRRKKQERYADFRMLPTHRVDPIVFLGGKDYVGLFQSLTAGSAGTRIIFFNSERAPRAPDCRCIRFETTTRTNWHYECAKALIAGALDIPVHDQH